MARSFPALILVAGLLPGRSALAESQPAVAAKPVSVKQVTNAAGGAAAVVVRTSGSSGSADQVRRDVDPQDNVERFLVLLPGGPMVVEARITLDGEPFRIAREKLVDEVLELADSDGDGQRTWREAIGNPRFGFGRYQRLNFEQKLSVIGRYDANKDGLVDRYEARLSVAEYGNGAAFRVGANPYAGTQPDVKSVLDTNKDGDITADELKVAGERLKSRDANDNDLLEAGELGGSGTQYQYRVVNRGQPTARPSAVFLLGSAADLAAVDQELRRRYARSDDKTLTADSFPLFPKLLETLDTNANGELEAGEAIGFQLLEPQLVLEVRLGEKPAEENPGIRVVSMVQELGSKEVLESELANEQTLALPGVRIKLIHTAGSAYRTANYESYANSILGQIDFDKNGYLERKELEENETGKRYLASFDAWDADADGKVFRDEIAGAYTKQLAPLLSQVALSAGEEGSSIFKALDTTGDNRLSLREMRTAGERLLSLDKNGDGLIEAEEIPTEITLAFGRGGASYYAGNVQFRRVGYSPQRPAATQPGPKWFVHMDRNGDGDVTEREFLGTAEQFQKLDTNADGFIELKEAEAHSPADPQAQRKAESLPSIAPRPAM